MLPMLSGFCQRALSAKRSLSLPSHVLQPSPLLLRISRYPTWRTSIVLTCGTDLGEQPLRLAISSKHKKKFPVLPQQIHHTSPEASNMMSSHIQPWEVLLIGSIPLASAAECFTTALRSLPSRLQRVPDGETGDRGNFIAWQHSVFPIAIIQPRWGGIAPPESSTLKYTLPDIKPTTYDDRALASYATFCELRSAGAFLPGLRFQVSLPTPYTVVRGFIETEYCAIVEPLYEERLLQSIHRMQREIPRSDLVIQFDLPAEIAGMEYERGRLQDPYFEPYFSPFKPGILQRLTHLAAALSTNVELGFHLCYGDMGHVHFVQPIDAALLVEMANGIVQNVGTVHHIKYIHMPVPKDRTDEAYFKPLENLELHGTQLFLGVVHPNDRNGTQKRIEAAQAVYPHPFGISTECGLGRTPPEELDSILEIFTSLRESANRIIFTR